MKQNHRRPGGRAARWILAWALAFAPGCLFALACGPRPGMAPDSVAALRESGQSSNDAETLSRWMLGELLSPGGSAERARQAREKLDAAKADHYLAHLGRGLDDAWHGRMRTAPDHFMAALDAASRSSGVEARLVAWFSASQAASMASHAPELWGRSRERVERLIEQPHGIGWRARAHLVQWWLDQSMRGSEAPADRSVEHLGCVTALRLAGPFGTTAPVHLHRQFAPEQPGPWPQYWPSDPNSGVSARVLGSRVRGCEVMSGEPTPGGVFYAESYFELAQSEDIILAAQGALAVWIDDRLVLDRDPLIWGVWPRFGVHVRLSAGRHRVLARLPEPRTLLRVMRSDGTPLDIEASTLAGAPYALEAPELLDDPNDVMHFVGPNGARGEPSTLERFLAAELAHLEGEDDVASVLALPLTEPRAAATGPSLMRLADWADGDPAFAEAEANDRARALYESALAKDRSLWRAELGLILAKASSGGLAAVAAPLEQLSRRFPDVPAIWAARGAVLGRLGWVPEQRKVVLEMAQRFGDRGSLEAAFAVLEQRGEDERANATLERLLSLDASSDARLQRALRQQDYRLALAEIERLARREEHGRAELERRRHEVRLMSGQSEALFDKLTSAVAEAPENGALRLALADARRAAGDPLALHTALAEATQAGADTRPLERAIDAVEAKSDFAPFRLDGLQVIRDYERADRHQTATAARVLDYAAVWVHSDGSSRMLEHEIVRIQSAEAISKFAEQRKLSGLVLNMRVIKRGGRTLEPEQVEGKPTVTFPHLEVGDYVETEHVQGFQGAEHGQYYGGLRWFFREEDVAYSRSEFVLIAPAHRPLDIEITGDVPEPEVVQDGALITRRWRVDNSPAAPVEPLSPPVQEFLPSVRVGWGSGLERRLRLLSEQVADTIPVDPRIRELARGIAVGTPASKPLERARRAYRWVQDNVKDGSEIDGRKALTGKSGNRWSALRMLLRALDIPVSYAVVKNRLAPAALGRMSEAEAHNVPLLFVGEAPETAWLTLAEQYAPFGYVPAEARGMPGHQLSIDSQLPVVVPAIGDQDRLEYEGSVELGDGGAARLSLTQRFVGKYAMRLRAGLEQVPEGRLHEVLEGRLLAQALPGAQLLEYEIVGQRDLDAPLELKMLVALGNFADVQPDRLVIEPPLMPKLGRLATLPARQTPLLVREPMHQRARLTIRLPRGARVWGTEQGSVKEGDDEVLARDSVKDGVLVLDREVSIAAGRVSSDDYAKFLAFTERADRLISQPIVISTSLAAEPAAAR